MSIVKTSYTYKDCEVKKVTKKVGKKILHVVHLLIPNTEQTISISVQNSLENIVRQLEEFKEGKRNKCYFAKDLINVDIVRDGETNDYYIVESISNDEFYSYKLTSVVEIERMIDYIKSI